MLTMEKKIDKCRIGMQNERRYLIVRQDPRNGEVTFFNGFFNEVDCIGTEDECQCWENESWVDDKERASKFKDYSEAKAIFDNLEDNSNCNLMMYGWAVKDGYDAKGFDGSNWFPLKTFTK